MPAFAWYRNRIYCMSIPELVYRLRTALVARAQRCGLWSARVVPAPRVVPVRLDWLCRVPEVDPAPYVAAADRVAAGRLHLFGLGECALGVEPDWNRDPKTGRRAPLVFGKTLDYRDPRLVGDIKYLWEPNRHLHWVVLAQAHRLTGRADYLEALALQLASWLRQCPYPLGPNWTSSLEVAIRLINWAIVWQLVGDALFQGPAGERLRAGMLEAVYRQAYFIRGHLSRFSSANNHLIGEAAGLLVAGLVWPFWGEARRWAADGRRILLREALRQNSADGVNREQSTAYQRFVAEFLLLAGLCARAAGRDLPRAYWQRLEAMSEFLAAVTDVAGRVPMIGDADDGQVARLAPGRDFCPYRSLLATGALLFGRPALARKAGAADDQTLWLLGSAARDRLAALRAARDLRPLPRTFANGGYYLLGTGLDSSDELRLLVDAGPLGYLSIAAHGHADALSLLLSVAGREFLVDPGTYAYHGAGPWRAWFRGTAAHNTVRVDGEDQSLSGGNFLWLRHARAACDLWYDGPDQTEFRGWHDGYLRLPDPLLHRRWVRLLKAERRVLIEDEFQAEEVHTIERFWHFSEQCRVALDGTTIVAENDGVRIRLVPGEAVEARLYCADEAPIGGWVSRGFDVKVPGWTVVWRCRVAGRGRVGGEIRMGG